MEQEEEALNFEPPTELASGLQALSALKGNSSCKYRLGDLGIRYGALQVACEDDKDFPACLCGPRVRRKLESAFPSQEEVEKVREVHIQVI